MPSEVKPFVQCHIKMQLKPRTDQFLKSSEAQTPCLNSLKALPSHHSHSHSAGVTLLPKASRYRHSKWFTPLRLTVHTATYYLSLVCRPVTGQWVIQPSILPTCVHTLSPVDFSHWLHGHITILWTQPSPAELQLLDSSDQAIGYYRLHILNPTVGFPWSSHIQHKGTGPHWPPKSYPNLWERVHFGWFCELVKASG